MESKRRLEVPGHQRCRTTSSKLLWLQEVALKLHLDPLKLLLGSIASDGDESSSHDGYLRVRGFGVCRTKYNENGPLFIGVSVLTHRGCEVIPFLSINRTQTWLQSKDFGKRKISDLFQYGNRTYPVMLAALTQRRVGLRLWVGASTGSSNAGRGGPATGPRGVKVS
jgi:hypothetical protein